MKPTYRRGVSDVIALLMIMIISASIFFSIVVSTMDASMSRVEGLRSFSLKRDSLLKSNLRLEIQSVDNNMIRVNLSNIGNTVVWLYKMRKLGAEYVDFRYVRSTNIISTNSTDFQPDPYADINIVVDEPLRVLIIYSASNRDGDSEFEAGKTVAIEVDGQIVATMSQSSGRSNRANEVTVIAFVPLSPGGHRIRGLYMSNVEDETVTISERQLSVILFRCRYGDFFYIRSQDVKTTTSTNWMVDAGWNLTLMNDTVALVIYSAGSFYGQTEDNRGTKFGISVDGVVVAEHHQSSRRIDYPVSGTVFWIGRLSNGIHEIKAVFASNSGETVTIGERQFLVLLLPTDTLYDYIRDITPFSVFRSFLVDDPYATVSRTLTDSRDVFAVYSATNYDGDSEGGLGKQVAVNIDGVDTGRSYQSAGLPQRKNGATAFYMGTLGPGIHTIKGRVASNGIGWAYVRERQLLVIYFKKAPRYAEAISPLVFNYYGQDDGLWHTLLVRDYIIYEVGILGVGSTFDPGTHTWLNPGEYAILVGYIPPGYQPIDITRVVIVVFIAHNGARAQDTYIP